RSPTVEQPSDKSLFFSSRRRHTSFSRDWSSDVCSSDLIVIMPIISEPAEKVVTVLAGWEDEEPDDVQSLVVFDGWSIVQALYALVNSQDVIQRAIRRSGAFRVLGASIEVDSPSVNAWLVEEVGYLSDSVALGEGLLLSEREAAAVRRGRE